MSWTRLDDGWTERPVFDVLDYAARWHYLALIQRCSRTGRYDGVLPYRQALRCSDVPDPDEALATLEAVELVDIGQENVTVRRIDEHLPPEGMRPGNHLPRKARNQSAYRQRKCERGEHSKECPAATCPAKLARSNGESVTNRVTGNTGTGRDGSPREHFPYAVGE